MCILYSYNKRKENSTGAPGIHGVWPLKEYSNVIFIIFLFVNINFMETWINKLDKNVSSRCLAYRDKFKYSSKILNK